MKWSLLPLPPGEGEGRLPSNRTAVVLPPQTNTATRSPAAGRYRPDSKAANAAAPPGSATTHRRDHKAACAWRIASSVTSTLTATCAWAMGNISPPTCRGARLSAAIPPAGASTGRPAARAMCSVGAPSGSTATTLTAPPYQAAIPPISPPPPTATSKVSTPGASACNSSPTVPWPSKVSGWSKAWTAMAPVAATCASLAARASA